jgi:hypothetical protein
MGFDDAGCPTPTVQPDVYRDPSGGTQAELPESGSYDLLRLLLFGLNSAEEVGIRVMLIAYIMSPPHQRPSLATLGHTLGISKQAVSQRLTRFREILPEIAREVGFEG